MRKLLSVDGWEEEEKEEEEGKEEHYKKFKAHQEREKKRAETRKRMRSLKSSRGKEDPLSAQINGESDSEESEKPRLSSDLRDSQIERLKEWRRKVGEELHDEARDAETKSPLRSST